MPLPSERERPKVVCVDDEPLVLDGLSLQLGRRFEVFTASSGTAGLDILSRHPDTAVVLSDMRMPGMDGTTFLSKARQVRPQASRILLTGYSDLEAAVAAVNEGQLFRFLTKPCPPPELLKAVEAASEQHQLFTAERVLLEQTLRGSIKALTDVLAITSPVTFSRAARIKTCVSGLADQLGLKDRWQVEVAAMLSQLGFIALPPETVAKLYDGEPLTEEEAAIVAQVPSISERLLGGVPRLEVVRNILKTYSGPYRPPSSTGAQDPAKLVRNGAHLLRVAVDFDSLEAHGAAPTAAIEIMRARAGAYDPALLDALAALRANTSNQQAREIAVADLKVGMLFTEDVKTDAGVLLAGRGLAVTTGMLERLRNMRKGTIAEPLHVIATMSRES